MIRTILSLMFLFQCSNSSKLETLPSNARTIPGDYVVMLPSAVDIDHFIATLNDYHLTTTNILYVYNETIPSAAFGSKQSLQGLALSNVSDVGLQELLGSDLVAVVTPVRSN
jgi:hypothetical protein